MKTMKEITDDAVERFPEVIYRYQPPKEDRLESVMLDNLLHLSSPSSFNDPFDCRVCVDTSGTLAQIMNKMRKIIKDRHPEWSHVRVSKEVIKWKKEGRHKNLGEKDLSHVINDVGILSMTAKNDNLLMWSHYAQGHEGVCLEFTPEAGRPDRMFNLLYPIYYETKVPVLEFFKCETSDRILEILLTKSVELEYEQEWRIWREDIGPGDHAFNPNKLTGLIFGSKADATFIANIVEMNNRREEPLVLYKAEISDREFSVDIVPL